MVENRFRMSHLDVVIFSRGAGNQQYGLGLDARILEQSFREMAKLGKISLLLSHKDPYTYVGTEKADIHVHLEIPCRGAFPWARLNIVIPNPEWWCKNEWKWVLDEPTVFFMFRTHHAQAMFPDVKGTYIGWRCPSVSAGKQTKNQVLYIVGGSKNKIRAADTVVRAWKPQYPPLMIVAAEKGVEKENVEWVTGYITNEEKTKLQAESKYHCVASEAEGFGYTMAEAMAYGAQPLWTDLPVYVENWGDVLREIGCIKTQPEQGDEKMLEGGRVFTEDAVQKAVESMLDNPIADSKLRSAAMNLTKSFRQTFNTVWKRVEGIVKKSTVIALPPVPVKELPMIGVITLVHNRPRWFPHAVRNIELTNYPRDKFVWIVVDDSDSELRVDGMVERVKEGYPDLQLHYVSLAKKTPIGEKRNLGCSYALSVAHSLTAFAFMDDDDHYPANSLNTRIDWLVSSKSGAVACATLPMYDIPRYISAVNVPPLDLDPCQRVSEATLCFTRDFWQERKFPSVDVAEGEGFLKERNWIEIPPKDVIVSFLHGKNSTSRRVPEQKEANGCHYGFSDEYFTMISETASRA